MDGPGQREKGALDQANRKRRGTPEERVGQGEKTFLR